MYDLPKSLPADRAELRVTAEGLVELAKAQALQIEKLNGACQAQSLDIAGEAIKRIALLYKVQKPVRGKPPEERVALRQKDAKPVFDDLETWLDAQLSRISGRPEMAKAIRYALGRMKKMRGYLENGVLELDTDVAERSSRCVAMLRKNALFAGSPVGGRNWAVMASLMASCRMNSVEPYAYLNWVFSQMANGLPRSQYDTLLPWH